MGFNPRSPRGGATIKFVKSSIVLILFQSTLPTRGSDFNFRSFFKPDYGFNPRSPRGGATRYNRRLAIVNLVSIHAPHEGERRFRQIARKHQITVSIHAPHEGERRRKSAFVCSISANLLNIIHCGTVTRAVSRRRIALFRLFSVRRSGVFMYAYASH